MILQYALYWTERFVLCYHTSSLRRSVIAMFIAIFISNVSRGGLDKLWERKNCADMNNLVRDIGCNEKLWRKTSRRHLWKQQRCWRLTSVGHALACSESTFAMDICLHIQTTLTPRLFWLKSCVTIVVSLQHLQRLMLVFVSFAFDNTII